MRCITVIFVVALAGCTTPRQVDNDSKSQLSAAMSEYNLHDYAGSLVMQLLQNAPVGLPRGRVVIGNFAPVDNAMVNSSSDISPQFGQQLRQSMQTLLTQAGFQIVTLEGSRALQLAEDYSLTLGKISTLPNSLKVDYILDGSVIMQQHAYLVNTKLVDIAKQHIATAATAEIPVNVFWSRDKVQMRNGRLYRLELEGARQ